MVGSYSALKRPAVKMRLLVIFVIAAVAAALPRKPTKDFPKKYNSTLDGLKDTYGTYEETPAGDLVVPAETPFLDALLPPSSYDAYFERQPEDPILPPEGSSYTGVNESSEGEALVPPPVDTYSAHSGSGHFDLVPPPVSPQEPEGQKSYVSYEEGGQESLAVPALSTYAQSPSDKSGADVLASLASMVHALPTPSTYESYDPTITFEDDPNAPSLILRPPRAQENPEPSHSSYSEVADDQPTLTPEQIMAVQEALIPLPVYDLIPPTL
ncbi:uncharacterized protein LOC135209600 [Macrobrachium nipponense]|uniref:uncharacterized protein LOC135209600 n=1 Tax=Macrobrachium nipponense TaxID=159736 RepID=UPI0030C7CDCE